MAELQNLTDQDVSLLRDFFVNQIQPKNPEAKLMITRPPFPLDRPNQFPLNESPKDLEEKIKKLEEKIDALKGKIDRIFGDYCLINGKWVRFPVLNNDLPATKNDKSF